MTSQDYEMSRDLEAALVARKFPLRIQYGPERAQRQSFGHTVVIERDRDGSDSADTVLGARAEPRRQMTRHLALEARIYVTSGLPGARACDHIGECDLCVDGFLGALNDWATEARAVPLQIGESRYLKAAELDATYQEQYAGVVYRIRFRLPRGVSRRDYTGELRPSAVIAGTSNRVEIQQKGSSSPPEIVEIP